MSAMFDEWAYHEVFEPPSPPSPVPATRSLLHSVAQLTVDVPEPELRPRSVTVGDFRDSDSSSQHRDKDVYGSKSVSNKFSRGSFRDNLAAADSAAADTPIAKSPAIDTPLTKTQLLSKWSLREWLGAEDPTLYDFDTQIWTAETEQFQQASVDARLAARLVHESKQHAADVEREIDWILHELEDTCERDLAALKLAAAHAADIDSRRNEVAEVKSAISTVWDTQIQCSRILKGPAPKAIPHILRIMQEADAALRFCSEHKDFLDIETTVQDWVSLALRALAITTAYASHELRKITVRCGDLVKGSQGGAGAIQALIYTKFGSDSETLVPFISLLRMHSQESLDSQKKVRDSSGTRDSQSSQSPLDLQLLAGFQGFADLQFTYFQLRMSLISTIISDYLSPLRQYTSISDDFIDAARNTLIHFRQLYSNEEQLFISLFGNITAEFTYWIEDLSDPLFVTMRRVIVHETDIGKLCQVIVLVQRGTSSDRDEDRSVKGNYNGEGFTESNIATESLNEGTDGDVTGSNENNSYFDTIHKDAQNRLVFRANILVDNYSRFVPEPHDFSRSKFPIVEQALDLLGQVFQLLSSHVFNELAHRCVRECLAKLDSCVANRIASKHTPDLKTDLFHIKQLLILQSQIVDFDLKSTLIQEIDFSGIKKLFNQYQAGQSFRELLYQAWDSVPRVVEIMFDAMEEIFSSLRMAVDRLCESFIDLLDFDLTRDTDNQSIKLREGLTESFEQLNQGILEFIGEREVHAFLLDNVQERVMDKYTDSYRQLPYFGEETENLMDIDTMSAWLSTVIPKPN